MNSDHFDERSTSALMNIIQDKDAGNENRYAATQSVLRRWRQGVDLEFLVDLLLSESSRDRLRGAHYLAELGQEVEGLNVAATQLADDALSDCRRAFVEYTVNSGRYDQTISNALAKCLLDLNLYVRVEVINWAVHISDERFENFSQLVEAGAGWPEFRFPNPLSNDFWNASILKRAVRGLNIIRCIRDGKGIEQIKKDFPEEDSFIFDIVQFSKTRRERLTKWLDKSEN
ncbi:MULTISPECIES: hypothetical protein [Rhizobium]|uniref:HEAT repeat domain-containing protein n=1 Tax=Rhizobium esperanzae TaxID=1967781 RepID=A0A7W6UFI4_9HYPH|nr:MULTISPECIES: hypothetical protein [Rhizobium]MBB4437156.1 hypothetical protein [Rhizobium esperanzae]MDH6199732.1 hypothetical protein [Rhizobium leguminosarum]